MRRIREQERLLQPSRPAVRKTPGRLFFCRRALICADDLPVGKAEVEINLYRIVQEALNNVVKHAKPKEVIVQVRRVPQGSIEISVFDTGKGFEPAHADHNSDRQGGFGLTGMSERAKVLGSRLEIKLTPGPERD